MLSSLKALAAAADLFNAQQRATLTETDTALTLSALGLNEVVELLPLVNVVGWHCEIVDAAGEHTDAATLSDDFAPFIVTIKKPDPELTLRVVTIAGLCNFLMQERTDVTWEVVMLSTPFSTMHTNFLPWGSSALYSPAPPTKSPRSLVKDQNEPHRAPSDVRVWMPRIPPAQQLWDDIVFQSFAGLSAQALMRSLAGEIRNDGSLAFRGPPNTLLGPPQPGSARELSLEGYNDLRNATAWVYENSIEAEQRHGLFVSEFGLNHPTETQSAAAFKRHVSAVLDGAKLTYQLSLSDLTRDAIKAQGDLRKAVADDAAKLADNTRQVVTAVAATLATSVGLIAAKVGTSAPPWAIQIVSVISAVYVATIIISGLVYMNVQKQMRIKWRSRLYRFVPDDDYRAMVQEPARRAEVMFIVSIVGGLIIAGLAVVAVFLVPGAASPVREPWKVIPMVLESRAH